MSDLIEIVWTAGNIDEARKICRYLVQERLVACAQIIPWIESIYMWDNKLETSQECKISLKTRREHSDKVRDAILKNHSYEIPEILFHSIEGGNKEYLSWIEESTPDFTRKEAQ